MICNYNLFAKSVRPYYITTSANKILKSPLLQPKHQTNFRSMSTSSTNTSNTPIVELREYEIHAKDVLTYTKLTTDASDLRQKLSPLRIFSFPETGGTLNIATHFYYFQNGYTERSQKRLEMTKNEPWNAYLVNARPCMKSQSSTIFVEAPIVQQFPSILGLAEHSSSCSSDDNENTIKINTNPGILEIRRYQLKLGYDTIPKFLSLYSDGLPSKLNAPGTHPSTSLITLLYSEVGQLNQVIEIWKHDDMQAMEQSRVAARSASQWRNSIAEIANLANVFNTTIHKPLSFSPIR